MFNFLLKFISLSMFAVVGAYAAVGQLQQVSGFGTNPTGVQMFTYRPPGLVSNPALIVAMHYCTGTAQAYFTGTNYANLADQLKTFMLIYPDAPDSGGCWDVHSTGTLTHNGGGDSIAIASMVKYAITNYGVDANRVFATGTSSGAMMTNVLAGAYPDVFRAGAAFAGVPYACFAGSGMWNSACANGQSTKTGPQWGDLVRNGYPGYTGPRTRMQVWHGTRDQTLNYNNFREAIKQWTNVLGVSETPSSTQQNSPISGWTRTSYGPDFQAISANNVDHNIPVQANDVLNWFGITGNQVTTAPPVPTTTPPNTAPPTTTTPATPTLPPPVTTTTAAGPAQTHWGQCGGSGYTGPTVCESPYTCTALNTFYSQCI